MRSWFHRAPGSLAVRHRDVGSAGGAEGPRCIDVDETFVHESVIGSIFGSHVDRLATVGPHDAVIPRISGQAYITEISQVGLDLADQFPTGYGLSDIWPTNSREESGIPP